MVPTTSYDIIARDRASRAFLGVADSAEEMAATVKKSFESQEATVRRANSRLMADLKAQEASLVKAQTAAAEVRQGDGGDQQARATLNKVAGGSGEGRHRSPASGSVPPSSRPRTSTKPCLV
jgi:hypothetical protein